MISDQEHQTDGDEEHLHRVVGPAGPDSPLATTLSHINTARGALVDTQALLAALEAEHCAGAGLDVFESETLIKEENQLLSNDYDIEELRRLVQNFVLLRRENVVVTPHIAFNSTEALERILLTTIRNIQSFEAGKPANVVT